MENYLTFSEKNLFNSEILHQYDEDGQKGFLGYLIRYKKWIIKDEKIAFVGITTKSEIENLLSEYNAYLERIQLQIQQQTIRQVAINGIDTSENMIKNNLKKLEQKSKLKNIENRFV